MISNKFKLRKRELPNFNGRLSNGSVSGNNPNQLFTITKTSLWLKMLSTYVPFIKKIFSYMFK